jgi:hypothetical protein
MLNMLTPTADKEVELWKKTLDHINDEDKGMIDAWTEDSNGILAFVSLIIIYSSACLSS